ncbi:MAG TPA: DNA recombination protein RmuC, partial [Candidatus Cryosericum sp.]|nr:DNA recombination protein RmuC [Candidatus Cryosericum sp.]
VLVVAGCTLGFLVAWAVHKGQIRTIMGQQRSIQGMLDQMKESFGALSLEALGKVSDQLVTVATQKLTGQQAQAQQELESKKALIDQQLQAMNAQLQSVQDLMNSLEKDRQNKFGELTEALKSVTQQTTTLGETTAKLREALASSRVRGAWGERMAEDILQAAGFKENINYLRQKTTGEGDNRPDFTFLLPNGLILNMDVKFPVENYMKAIEATTPDQAQAAANRFLADVRARVKEITTRDYIDEEHHTVPCVLLFVPIESVLAFAEEQDPHLIDYALSQRVVLCAPSSLFGVLAIVRQAVNTVTVERRSQEVLQLLNEFRKQWNKYTEQFAKLGKHLRELESDYSELEGARSRQLQRQLDKIDQLSEQMQLADGPAGGTEMGGEADLADSSAAENT